MFQIRSKLEHETAFEAITLESERMRLFREYVIAYEETCGHHHAKRKKSKKHKVKRSRSRSHSVSHLYRHVIIKLSVGCL